MGGVNGSGVEMPPCGAFALAMAGAPVLDMGNMAVCFPFFLFLAFLFASLYAQGKSPLAYFDITSPRRQFYNKPRVRTYQIMSGTGAVLRRVLAKQKGGIISGALQKVGIRASKYAYGEVKDAKTGEVVAYRVRLKGKEDEGAGAKGGILQKLGFKDRTAGQVEILDPRTGRWSALKNEDGRAVIIDAKTLSNVSAASLATSKIERAYIDGKKVNVGPDGKEIDIRKAMRPDVKDKVSGETLAYRDIGREVARQISGGKTESGIELGRVRLMTMERVSMVGGGMLGAMKRAQYGRADKINRFLLAPRTAQMAWWAGFRKATQDKKGFAYNLMTMKNAERQKRFAERTESINKKVDARREIATGVDAIRKAREEMPSTYLSVRAWTHKQSQITTPIPLVGGFFKQYKIAWVGTTKFVVSVGRSVKMSGIMLAAQKDEKLKGQIVGRLYNRYNDEVKSQEQRAGALDKELGKRGTEIKGIEAKMQKLSDAGLTGSAEYKSLKNSLDILQSDRASLLATSNDLKRTLPSLISVRNNAERELSIAQAELKRQGKQAPAEAEAPGVRIWGKALLASSLDIAAGYGKFYANYVPAWLPVGAGNPVTLSYHAQSKAMKRQRQYEELKEKAGEVPAAEARMKENRARLEALGVLRQALVSGVDAKGERITSGNVNKEIIKLKATLEELKKPSAKEARLAQELKQYAGKASKREEAQRADSELAKEKGGRELQVKFLEDRISQLEKLGSELDALQTTKGIKMSLSELGGAYGTGLTKEQKEERAKVVKELDEVTGEIKRLENQNVVASILVDAFDGRLKRAEARSAKAGRSLAHYQIGRQRVAIQRKEEEKRFAEEKVKSAEEKHEQLMEINREISAKLKDPSLAGKARDDAQAELKNSEKAVSLQRMEVKSLKGKATRVSSELVELSTQLNQMYEGVKSSEKATWLERVRKLKDARNEMAGAMVARHETALSRLGQSDETLFLAAGLGLEPTSQFLGIKWGRVFRNINERTERVMKLPSDIVSLSVNVENVQDPTINAIERARRRIAEVRAAEAAIRITEEGIKEEGRRVTVLKGNYSIKEEQAGLMKGVLDKTVTEKQAVQQMQSALSDAQAGRVAANVEAAVQSNLARSLMGDYRAQMKGGNIAAASTARQAAGLAETKAQAATREAAMFDERAAFIQNNISVAENLRNLSTPKAATQWIEGAANPKEAQERRQVLSFYNQSYAHGFDSFIGGVQERRKGEGLEGVEQKLKMSLDQIATQKKIAVEDVQKAEEEIRRRMDVVGSESAMYYFESMRQANAAIAEKEAQISRLERERGAATYPAEVKKLDDKIAALQQAQKFDVERRDDATLAWEGVPESARKYAQTRQEAVEEQKDIYFISDMLTRGKLDDPYVQAAIGRVPGLESAQRDYLNINALKDAIEERKAGMEFRQALATSYGNRALEDFSAADSLERKLKKLDSSDPEERERGRKELRDFDLSPGEKRLIGELVGEKGKGGAPAGRAEFEDALRRLANGENIYADKGRAEIYDSVRSAVRERYQGMLDAVREKAGPRAEELLQNAARQQKLDELSHAINTGSFTGIASTAAEMASSEAAHAGTPEEKKTAQKVAEVLSYWSQSVPTGPLDHYMGADGKRIVLNPLELREIDETMKRAAGLSNFSGLADAIRRAPLVTERVEGEERSGAILPELRDIRSLVEKERKTAFEGISEERKRINESISPAMSPYGGQRAELAVSSILTGEKAEYISDLMDLREKIGAANRLNPDYTFLNKFIPETLTDKQRQAIETSLSRRGKSVQNATVSDVFNAVDYDFSNASRAVDSALKVEEARMNSLLQARDALNSGLIGGQLPPDISARYAFTERSLQRHAEKLREAEKEYKEAINNPDADPAKQQDRISRAKSKEWEASHAIRHLEYDVYKTAAEFEYRVLEAREKRHYAGPDTIERKEALLQEFPEFEQKTAAVRELRGAIEESRRKAFEPLSDEGDGSKVLDLVKHAYTYTPRERDDWYKLRAKPMEKVATEFLRYGAPVAAVLAGAPVMAAGVAAFAGISLGDYYSTYREKHNRSLYRDLDFLMLHSAALTDRGSGVKFTIQPLDAFLGQRQPFRTFRRSEEGDYWTMRGYETSVNVHEYLQPWYARPITRLYKASPLGLGLSSHGRVLVGEAIVGDEYFKNEYIEQKYRPLTVHPDRTATQANMPVEDVYATQLKEMKLAEGPGIANLVRKRAWGSGDETDLKMVGAMFAHGMQYHWSPKWSRSHALSGHMEPPVSAAQYVLKARRAR